MKKVATKKLRKLTKADKIQLWGEIENEGLGYWCQNYGREYENTEIGPLLKQAKEALDKLDDMYHEWEQIGLEEE